MDPDANLEEQLELAAEAIESIENGAEVHVDDVERLAELVLALDGWITNGGFLPKRWRKE